jgi:OmpA-OmpF porin, OOP family
MNRFPINKFLLAIVLMSATLPALAQTAADSKKSGDYYYKAGDYYSAASYYQAFIDAAKTSNGKFLPYTVPGGTSNKKDERAEIISRMADSYRMYHDYAHAEKAYEELKDNPAYPDARYWYALALRANGKYDEAKEQLKEYLKNQNASYAAAAKVELAGLSFMQEQMQAKDASLFTVKRAAANINSAESNFAVSQNDNKIIFTSSRPTDGKPGNSAAVYIADEKGEIQKIDLPASEATNLGAASLSNDGNHMYLTGWSNEHNIKKAAIYLSDKTATGWSVPRKLNVQVNMEGYNSQQPFVSADGKHLLFSSNRPGGMGGFDIWITNISENGDVGEATNAGKNINSAGDEEAPFYHEASQSLVFASNGRIGLGGFDLYVAKGPVSGSFSEANNLGYPVNSNKDDIYFYSANTGKLLEHAFISTDRNSDYCMSVYEVSREYKKYIAGTVTDCNTQQVVSNATVSMNNGLHVVSNANGSFIIEVKEWQAATVNATKEGYEQGSMSFNEPSNTNADTLNIAVCIKAVEQPKTKLANEVYFEFAKYELSEQTKTFLDTLAAVMTRESKLKLIATGYTDKIGSDGYNQNLSEQRAGAVKDYLVAKGIDPSRIETIGKGDCCSVKPENKDGKDDPDARQLNRRVEFILKLIMQ